MSSDAAANMPYSADQASPKVTRTDGTPVAYDDSRVATTMPDMQADVPPIGRPLDEKSRMRARAATSATARCRRGRHAPRDWPARGRATPRRRHGRRPRATRRRPAARRRDGAQKSARLPASPGRRAAPARLRASAPSAALRRHVESMA